MSFEIEQVSSIQKRLRFTVPGSEVAQKLDVAFRNLSTRVRIPGFRPGKVPRKMLEDRWGKQLRQEVAGELMNMNFQAAASQLEFVGQPTVEHADALGAGDFNFTIAVQVKPAVEPSEYTGLKIRFPLAQVTDDQVDMEVTRRLQGHARLVDLDEDRGVQTGDFVLTEIKDGGDVLEAGTMINTAAERYWPGIEALLIGLKKGESATGAVKIGDNAAAAANRGREFTATVTVVGIQVQQVPDLDDEVAKQAGFEGGAEAMKAAVRMDLETRANENGRNQARIQLLQELVKRHTVDVPAALTEHNLELLVKELGVQAAYRGRDPRSIRYSEAQMADLRTRAEFAAKAGLILEGVARKEGIEVTTADLDAKYQEIADQRGQRVEAIRGYIKKDGAEGELRKHLMEERTLDWVLERCELEYVSDNYTSTSAEASGATATEPEAEPEKPKAKKAKKNKADGEAPASAQQEAANAPDAASAVSDAAPVESGTKPKKKASKKKAED